MIARSSCLRSRNVVVGRVEHGPHVRAGPGQPGQLIVGELDRAASLLGEQVLFGLALRGELGFQGSFQGPGD